MISGTVLPAFLSFLTSSQRPEEACDRTGLVRLPDPIHLPLAPNGRASLANGGTEISRAVTALPASLSQELTSLASQFSTISRPPQPIIIQAPPQGPAAPR